jgi:uncharacterized repeat protein (TIGR03803 family)
MNKLGLAKIACIVLVFCAATARISSAQAFNVLTNFNGTNGEGPGYMSLVQGTDGNFYGTTNLGGANSDGTVFRVTTTGKLTTIYNFCELANCADGANPAAGLVLGTDGFFYGTTQAGGTSVNNNSPGTIFKISPGGVLKTLYSFCAQTDCADGSSPYAPLVQGTDGNFYGTANAGGEFASGTIFKISSAGTFAKLHDFCSVGECVDGTHPYGGLIQATNGAFYGMTSGAPGTVFEMTPAGVLSTIYTFCSRPNCTDGAEPEDGLVQAANGNFYGTTLAGGANTEGTVFELTPAGKLTTLHSFCSLANCVDGESPVAGLIQGSDGNLYGTTVEGGANLFYGSVFEVTPSGVLTTIHSFDNTDGGNPNAGLLQATNGTFYGVTTGGGSTFQGTVFSVSTGLKPFVAPRPASGKVGAKVVLLGTNLTGATAVQFDGTAATFTVNSKSEITTSVPIGAITGKITVTLAHSTVSSDVVFRVKP